MGRLRQDHFNFVDVQRTGIPMWTFATSIPKLVPMLPSVYRHADARGVDGSTVEITTNIAATMMHFGILEHFKQFGKDSNTNIQHRPVVTVNRYNGACESDLCSSENKLGQVPNHTIPHEFPHFGSWCDHRALLGCGASGIRTNARLR